MPSLRRTVSSPPARRSPYSYPSSLSNGGNATRTGGNAPRRSSGSDVSQRRVLADIDWWIVQDGQYDDSDTSNDEQDATGVEGESEHAFSVDAAPAPAEELGAVPPAWQPPTALGAGAFDSAPLPAPFFLDVTTESMYGGGSPEMLSPLPQFADLTISPRTPLRGYTNTYSAESSLASTPESTHFALLPVPGPFPALSASFMDLDTDTDSFVPAATAFPSSTATTVVRRPTSSGLMRTASYSFVESELSFARVRESYEELFDDIPAIPSPPPFFSLTRADVEDLFY